MGQYKVPQNVESEDKLLGPLTMKQFIYAIIGLAWGFLIWRILSPGGTAAIPIMLLLIVPISGFMLLLAFGKREEQSFENYLIALIRFQIMPRKRVWLKDDYRGAAIVNAPPPPKPTAPTQEDAARVHSRLQQLSLVVDTRGHVKSAEIQMPDQTNTAAQFSERVFTPSELQKPFLEGGVEAHDDVLATTEAQAHKLKKSTSFCRLKNIRFAKRLKRKWHRPQIAPSNSMIKLANKAPSPKLIMLYLKRLWMHLI
jgi:hypothetical protein